MQNQTDEQICRAVQNGDIEPFGVLVERYEAKLQRYARRFLFGYEEGQDLVQTTFLKAYQNIQSFNPDLKFSSWLYRIAHNEFINEIKKRGREPLSYFDPDTLFPHPIAKEQPETDFLTKDLEETIERHLGQLDPKYREPLVLFYFEGMDYQKIADILHIPVSTVGVRLSRAKQLLKKMLEKE